MTDGLSRRDLVVMGGAAAALASGRSAQARPRSKAAVAERTGINDNHGRDPEGLPTYPGPTAYNPKYIAIAVIDFVQPWMMDVHHASFPLNPSTAGDPDYRLDVALNALGWAVNGTGRKLGHLKDNQLNRPDLIPYKRKNGPHKDRHHVASFDGFKFYSQNEIFIFLKSPDIVLGPRLVRVTQYSDQMVPMDLNYSLFNARSVSATGSLGNHGKLIRVENHVRDPNGGASGAPTNYSMNIHFKMKVKPEGAEQNYVPMIIDPDTGNGTGNEP